MDGAGTTGSQGIPLCSPHAHAPSLCELAGCISVASLAPQLVQWQRTLPANAGDARDSGSIPGWGRSPGEGNGKLLQSSCLENPMDRGAWWATVQGVAKSQT